MDSAMRLQIASFNIRRSRGFDGVNSWPFRRRLTAETMERLGVDLVGLQEVFESQRRYLGTRLAGSRWFGDGRFGERRDEQCPVVVLNPQLTVLDHRTMWFGDHPDVPGTALPGASFPRIATIVRFRHDLADREFAVANTHLDERHHHNRVTSVQQLIAALDVPLPTIVMGDFNAVVDDHDVFAPLVDAGFQRAPLVGTTHHAFTGAIEGTQIDHLFASPHWTIEDSGVVRVRRGRRLPSDHWPIRATVSLHPIAG